ncbi:hypothetical protein CH330_07845 [candidate division WOR-3 bacterium JGI_Cruoil_03_51_56]|uniref:Uncharacterized protein n=1 Tax=candidate division WOR-3 bacterium JGI_Cruoil_03_51_56 TaxID=1973747 RepID=A0A235BRR4_UNCW3|nr:MAG: hypothetical protein CH330_07845 [candidate division WOR-3 bacterium JGI_Cruoil_03_51_56]
MAPGQFTVDYGFKPLVFLELDKRRFVWKFECAKSGRVLLILRICVAIARLTSSGRISYNVPLIIGKGEI